MLYKVAQVDVVNLQLTQFRQFWQLLGRYSSYLLPYQDDGTTHNPSQLEVFTNKISQPVEGHDGSGAMRAPNPDATFLAS